MINTLIFVLCLVSSGTNPAVYGFENVLKEDLELEQVKLMNKSPIKTINTEYGEVVDCIDINKQPAFDHPLLKNHKLQKKPSFQKPFEKRSVKNLSDRFLFGLHKDRCPKGTVPILRTTKKDLIQEKNLLNSSIFLQDIPGVHDPLTKNWWIGGGGHYMGYFSAKLFSNMGSADKVGFGGRTLTPRGSPSPLMGSGHFPDKNFYHASFYKFISVQNATRDYGPEKYQIENYIDKPKCFGLNYYGNLHKNIGYALQFGGPGGNCGN
ncbi:hypothetical protein VNO80_05814 [Phaseolus coccineus]|uniref:Neprosin PEP catalytic domain-containing protein n=1 Tax=Phaseolus coccineus TaxID=3886 RepID=A0AAN9NGD9_PHACN